MRCRHCRSIVALRRFTSKRRALRFSSSDWMTVCLHAPKPSLSTIQPSLCPFFRDNWLEQTEEGGFMARMTRFGFACIFFFFSGCCLFCFLFVYSIFTRFSCYLPPFPYFVFFNFLSGVRFSRHSNDPRVVWRTRNLVYRQATP